jgi:alkylation response protein AidB-like acyl-CoA dehydrogenase
VRLSEEHQQYRVEVRSFMRKVVEPSLSGLDMSTPLSAEQVRELHQLYSKHDIASSEPTLEDGAPDLVAVGIFTEELNRVSASLGAMPAALFFSNLPIRSLLRPDQLAVYGHLFEPGHLVSIGLSEPNVGSDPSGVETRAVRDAGDWVIDGAKMWTSNATISEAILVACKVPEDDGAMSLFIVERAASGYEPRTISCLGMTAISTCEVPFDGVRVPDLARIGEPRAGLGTMLGVISRARVNIAFTSVGIAQAALDLAVDYAKQRTQFGRPIASFQLVQEMLADMATEIAAGRLLALDAAALLSQGRPARAEVSMAKAFCTEMAVRVTSLGIQVHGGMGLTKECHAERYFRDARMQTIPDGTTQIHKLIIGRELVGISALI